MASKTMVDKSDSSSEIMLSCTTKVVLDKNNSGRDSYTKHPAIFTIIVIKVLLNHFFELHYPNLQEILL